MDQRAEERRWRFGGLLDTSAGTVGLLIAVVLLTQAGLVYVAVDQIGTSEQTGVIPARVDVPPRPPISVDTEQRENAPARGATRDVVEVQGPEGQPVDPGLDRARDRARPQGVAPPLTGSEPPAADAREGSEPPAADAREGSEPPAADAREAAPTEQARPTARPEDESPGASERAASESPSQAPASEDAFSAPPSDEEGDQGPGASDGDPPGHGGDSPGNGGGNDRDRRDD